MIIISLSQGADLSSDVEAIIERYRDEPYRVSPSKRVKLSVA